MKARLLAMLSVVWLILGVHAVFAAGGREAEVKQTEQVFVAALDEGPGGNGGDIGRPYSSPSGHTLTSLIYTSLTIFDGKQQNIIPHAAKSWTHNADYTVWQFVLDDRLTWSDGVPVTADDLKFTVEFVTDPAYVAQLIEDRNNAYQGLVGFKDKIGGKISSLDSARVVNSKTIEFTLSGPNPRYYANLYRAYILPRHAIDFKPSEYLTTQWWSNPAKQVGSGAFHVSGFMKDEFLQLAPNQHYFHGKPKLNKLIVRFFGGNVTAATVALAGGDVDFSYIEYGSIATLGSGFDIYSGLMGVPRMIHLNYYALPEFWKDIRVRKAIYHAIDRKAIAANVFRGTHQVIPSHVVSEAAWKDHDWYEYNPQKALALLAEAGVKPQDIVMNVMRWQTDSMTVGAMDAIQYYLSQIGIKFTHYPVDLPTWRSRWNTEGSKAKQWEVAYRGGTGLPYAMDPNHIFSNAGGEGGDFMGFDLDKSFSEVNRRFKLAATVEEFNAAAHALSLKMNQEIPHIYLVVGQGYGAANSRVKDFHWYPGTGGGPYLCHPEKWYIGD